MQVEQFPLNSPIAVYLGSPTIKALDWGTHPFPADHFQMCAGILTKQQKTETLLNSPNTAIEIAKPSV